MAMPLSGLRQIVAMQRIELGVSHFYCEKARSVGNCFRKFENDNYCVVDTYISLSYQLSRTLYGIYCIKTLVFRSPK